MTKDEMLASARQALEFNQGSMVIPLNHVEKFLAAQREELLAIKKDMDAQSGRLAELTKVYIKP